jgi:hypothetical protein
MDIKLPINLLNSSALNKLIENPLALKVGQKLDATVISSLLKTEITTIALKLANNTLTVQSNQPIKLMPGQDLQIQVTKIAPSLEFAIILSLPDLKRQSIAPDLRLKQITPSTSHPKTESPAESDLPVKLPLAAKIIALTDSKIQLQVFIGTESSLKPQQSAEPAVNKPSVMITIDRSQLQMPKTPANNNPSPLTKITPTDITSEFKIGQAVILEISSKRTTPAYRISVVAPQTTEDQVTEFIKQFLPKHESSPVLLNQLMKELPQLLKTSTVPEALQQIAAKILQNLTPRQQLNDSSGLKQATVNTGLFLEAKLSALKEAPGVTIDQDFKADLLKLVDVIKKEVANTGQSESQNQDLGALKNLQQKTENIIAKIILDQLTSLPKEDTPKQQWIFDIPFVDRGQADTVSLQITKDQENNPSSENEKDKWSVTLTMNPPGLGSIQCRLSYQNETINTYFRSQQTQTTELINDHVDHLKRQFEEAGLKPGIINVLDGLQTIKAAYQTDKNMLFDEKA